MFSLYMESPVSWLKLSGTEDLLHEILFCESKEEEIENSTPLLEEAKRQLNAYFAKKLKVFNLPFYAKGTPFQQKVWSALTEIPFGQSWSYMQLAIYLGDPKCIRASASANGKNPLPVLIPCHRVIGATNALVGYGGGLWRKEWLLTHEEHPVYRYRQGVLF